MMAQVIILFLVLLLPLSGEAAYKIYLKNGSVISGVRSYEKQGQEIMIQFGGGQIGISAEDISRIQESDTPEKDFTSTAPSAAPPLVEGAPPPAIPPAEQGDAAPPQEDGRVELDQIAADIREAEQNEARLKAAIDERQSRRMKYNTIQLRQLETDLEPLKQELFAAQQKKSELLQRKAYLEGEMAGRPR
jgi:hypothetical protein